jgi:hypothetical protein
MYVYGKKKFFRGYAIVIPDANIYRIFQLFARMTHRYLWTGHSIPPFYTLTPSPPHKKRTGIILNTILFQITHILMDVLSTILDRI